MDESKVQNGNQTPIEGEPLPESRSLATTQPKQSAIQNNSFINNLKDFDAFADYIIESDYAKNYTKTTRGEDGKVITTVSKADIVASLVLGKELGISPMGSITLGKKLNANSYYSIIRGRELGLSPITSVNKIYNISTTQGDVISLGVDIINKVIIENARRVELVRDYETVPKYYTIDNVYIGHYYNIVNKDGELKPNFYIYIKDVSTSSEIQEAVKSGKIVIFAKGVTQVSSLRIVTDVADTTYHYSIQEAIDAGLHRGYHSSLVDDQGKPFYVKGRSNWNDNPQTMLRNRVTSIGGRHAVPHKLQGGYSHEETAEILQVDSIEENE